YRLRARLLGPRRVGAGGDGLERLAAEADFTELHHFALGEEADDPVGQDAALAADARHAAEVVAAVHEPGEQALGLEPVRVGHALVQAEAGHRADVLVLVRLEGGAHVLGVDVVGQDVGLADGVLGAGRAVLHREVRGVGHLGRVARAPRAFDDLADLGGAGLDAGGDLEAGVALEVALGADRQVGLLQQRVGHDAGGPDDGVGVELLAVGEDDVAALAGLQRGAQADVHAALGELAGRVGAHLGADLG